MVDDENVENEDSTQLVADEGHILSSKTTEDYALEVLEGKWGSSDPAIRRRLVKHSIDPDPIMAEVARLR